MQILIERRTIGALLFPAMCAVTANAQAPATQDVLVQASKIVVAYGDGDAQPTVLTDSAILIRSGKVAYVGDDIPSEARRAARSVDFGNATISPGFVLAATTLGRDVDLGEGALAFTPDLRAAEAFDPWLEQLEQLSKAGVTSFGLSPSSRNVASGIGAVGKPGDERGRIAVPEAFVGFSVSRAARDQGRQPTSLMGAREMLRESFTAARDGVQVGPDLAVLRQVMSGQRSAFFYADTFAEINAVLETGANFNFAPVILGASEAERVIAKLQNRGAGVVLNTLTPQARIADLELPAKLKKAGIPFCFAGRPDLLRLSAALAVRHGLDRNSAHAALTRTPATMLGQQASIGSLRQGCGADFVVFEGDLLDLGARHVATWIDGKQVCGTTASGSAASGSAASTNPTNTTAGGR
jgi:imidazolonepropionase-like amidohydrolase